MGYRRVPFGVGEWYDCFTRGIDKRTTFESEPDYRRFVELLYLANDTNLIDRASFYHLSHEQILTRPRNIPIVAIGGYCLMGNHYHLLLHEIIEGGISQFMQKLGTGYSGYFNTKRARIGNLFVKPFRSKHIADESYLRHVLQYIHLNPAELIEPRWKSGKVRSISKLQERLHAYPFSSLPDYLGISSRIHKSILDPQAFALLRDGMPPLSSTLQDAQKYYAELEKGF